VTINPYKLFRGPSNLLARRRDLDKAAIHVLEPVFVGGVTVSRASLHNKDEIARLDIEIGDTVVIRRAADVIPQIIGVIKEMREGTEKKFIFPKRVSACGGDGRIEKISGQVAYRCVNKTSFEQQKRKFYHFVSKKSFDIDGLGPSIIDLLLENNLISSYEDIFSLKKGDLLILPRFAEKSVDNLLEAIEKSREIELAKFLVGLSIDQVGEETAIDLANHFNSLKELREASLEDLKSVYGIGDIVAESIYDWFKETGNRLLLNRLLKEVRIKKDILFDEKSLIFKNKRFVLTGSLKSMGRDEAKDKIRKLGGSISSSISKNVDYVVVGEKAGSKLEKARQLSIKILNEKEFLKLVK